MDEKESPQWNNIDDSEPGSVPNQMGYYLVACEGGNVTLSFYVTDLKYLSGKNIPSRKSNGKYSRRFEVAQKGYKITHWMEMPLHPIKL